MERCWDVEPTLKRVVQDIEDWEFVLDKIIAARGVVVHGLALRHGKRQSGTVNGLLPTTLVVMLTAKDVLSHA